MTAFTTPIRLLLADDHKILRDALRQSLEQEPDIEVVAEAGNGLEAVTLVTRHSPDVVIMDISMPDLNGIEATRRILAVSPEQKIIALSMYGDHQYLHGMLKAGVRGYLLKTTAFDELAGAIRRVAGGERVLGSELAAEFGDFSDVLVELPDNVELSSREREVLQMIAEGRDNSYIAEALYISRRTVESHRQSLRGKLGLHSVAELTRYAIQKGIITL